MPKSIDNSEIFVLINDTKQVDRIKAQNQSSKIENILEKLASDNLADIQVFKKEVESFYDANERHRYSDVTTHLFHLHMKQDGKIDNIRKNIALLMKLDNTERLQKHLLKLQDHILLEILRLNNIEEIKNQIEKTSKEVQESKNQIEKTSKEVQESKNQIEKTSKEVQESKKSYITILGIFAAIVLAFVSGLSFSNSVLSNIHQASIYRLIFVMAFISFFVGNILNFLFNFLSKLTSVEEKKQGIVWFNAVIFIIMVIDFFVYFIMKYNCYAPIS